MENKAITFTESPTFSSDGTCTATDVTVKTGWWEWEEPILVETIKNDDSVELIYRQNSRLNYYPFYSKDKVFKIICSCKDGKWNEERVEGVIIPKSDERFEF